MKLIVRHNPYTWMDWQWWLNYQIDAAAQRIKDELLMQHLRAQRELHSALNQAQLDIVTNSGRRLAWRAHRSTL